MLVILVELDFCPLQPRVQAPQIGAFERLQCLPGPFIMTHGWEGKLQALKHIQRARWLFPMSVSSPYRRTSSPSWHRPWPKEAMLLWHEPPLPTPVPSLKAPTSSMFRLIPAFHGPTLYTAAKRCSIPLAFFLIPLHTSLSVIYCHVTNYPKCNDIKNHQFFSLHVFCRSGT